MAKPKRILLIVVSLAAAVLIAAAAFVVIPILTHESGGSSGQVSPTGFTSEVTATGDDGRTRTLTITTETGQPADLADIAPGDELIVEGKGFDAATGIYVGLCKIPDDPTLKPGPCLGGIPDDAQEEKSGATATNDTPLESAWVTDNWAWKGFASHQYLNAAEGTFRVHLLVPAATVEGLDCTTERCAVYTRADHTALNDRVQDLFLPIRFTQ